MHRMTAILVVYALPVILLVGILLGVWSIVIPWYVFIIGIPLALCPVVLIAGSIALAREEAILRSLETKLAASFSGLSEELVAFRGGIAPLLEQTGVTVVEQSHNSILLHLAAANVRDNPAFRAARSAKEMVKYANVLNEGRWHDAKVVLKIAIGISTGDVASETASQLASAAKDDNIFLSAKTRMILSEEQARELGCQPKRIQLDGLPEEITVYEVNVNHS